MEPGLRPRRPELFQNGQSRAFALVGHVLLVGHADQQDVRAVQALAGLPVDGLAQPVDDIIRHGPVDLARKLDETGRLADAAGLPGEIERVDRDAVPAEARAGIEGHVAERLGRGRLDDFPDIDIHGAVDHLQLVHQGDIHRPEHVLGDLHGLRRRRRRDRHDLFQYRVVERDGELSGRLVNTADHLRNPTDGIMRIAGIFPFRREGKEQVRADRAACLFQDRPQHLVCGAGIGRRFQHHQRARIQYRSQRGGRVADIAQIRVALRCQRCWHADQHRVRCAEIRDPVRRQEIPRRDLCAKPVHRNVRQIGALRRQRLDLRGVDIVAGHPEPGAQAGECQGQADIAEPDHANARALVRNSVEECLHHHGLSP